MEGIFKKRNKRNAMKKYQAEFLGTFALVFCGTGAIIVNDLNGGVIAHLGIALTFGLIIAVMIYAFGETSGAHFNPAVTVSFWFTGKLSGKMVLPYITSQLLGALLASVTLLLLFPTHSTLGGTVPANSIMQSFVLEIIITFFLMTVIIQVTTNSKAISHFAGLAIGGTVLLAALFAGPISGASMNPARSLGPALVSGELNHFWIYLTAPFIGTLLAGLSCRSIKGKECCSCSPFSKK